jgi:hypothetical protein
MATVDELTKRRLAQNEAMFRTINEKVLELEDRFGSRDGGFICECADPSCAETVLLTLDEYARIHEDKQRFFVVPGHEVGQIENVLERHDHYLVVEKQVPVPDIAR